MRDDRRGRDGSYFTRELTRLLGHTPAGWFAETLTHNTSNAVTAGIWCVRAGSLSAILKVISPPGGRSGWTGTSSTQTRPGGVLW